MATTEVIANFAPKNDPSKHTAAYKICHYRFIVRIAQMHLISQQALDNTWRVTSGNAAVDRAMAEELVQAQLTIAEMAEHHANGATMSLVNPEDSTRIYGIIHEHLMDWMRQLQTSVTVSNAPLEDLRRLDALAGDVYLIARYYWQKTPYHGKLTDFLQKLSRTVGGQVGRTSRRDPANILNEPAQQPEQTQVHTPMADALAKLAHTRTRSWS